MSTTTTHEDDDTMTPTPEDPAAAAALDAARRRVVSSGGERARAVRRLDEATEALRGDVVAALAAGMTESEASRVAGVTRMTIRAWAGK